MLQHLCWPTLQQRRNQHQSPCYTNYNTDQFPFQIHTTQFHQEITNSYSHSLPQIIIYAHFSLEQSGCGIHYQTRELIAQTWMFSSLVPNHSSIVNILCCFYPKKKNVYSLEVSCRCRCSVIKQFVFFPFFYSYVRCFLCAFLTHIIAFTINCDTSTGEPLDPVSYISACTGFNF